MKEDESRKKMQILIERDSKQEGAKEREKEIAKKLIVKGHTNDTIKDGTDLTDNEINKIRNELKNK